MHTFLGILCLVWGILHIANSAQNMNKIGGGLLMVRIAFAAFLFWGAWRFLG